MVPEALVFPLKGRLRVGWRKSAAEHSSQGTQGEFKKKTLPERKKLTSSQWPCPPPSAGSCGVPRDPAQGRRGAGLGELVGEGSASPEQTRADDLSPGACFFLKDTELTLAEG